MDSVKLKSIKREGERERNKMSQKKKELRHRRDKEMNERDRRDRRDCTNREGKDRRE